MTDQPILNRRVEAAAMALTTYSQEAVGSDPIAWLTEQAQDGMTLLAHADDGVIWGRVMGGKLVFPKIAGFTQAALRRETLQMARLFDEDKELFLWRTGESAWQARQVQDRETAAAPGDSRFPWAFDEQQVLWGTGITEFDDEFSLAQDGEEGFHHAPPVGLQPGWFGPRERLKGERKLRLTVRHYLTEDEQTGWLRIGLSRLVSVGMEEGS